jgi:hypothetical protein
MRSRAVASDKATLTMMIVICVKRTISNLPVD